MRNIKLALRTLFKTPFVTGRRHPLAGAGHRGQRGDLLVVQRDPAPAAPRGASRTARQPRRAGTAYKDRTRATRPATATRSSATRCSAISSRRTRPSAASAAHRSFGVNFAMPGQTPISGDGMLVSGSYFPMLGLRPRSAGSSPPTTTGRSAATTSPCSSYSYWQNQLGSDPNVVGPEDHDQRPADDDHRRRAATASTARRSARGRTSSCRSRCARVMSPGCTRVRRRGRLLGLSVRAAQAGHDDRAGARGDQHGVSADHQRRRGAAPEGDEPADDDQVPRQEGRSLEDGRRGQSRRCTAKRRRRCCCSSRSPGSCC